MDKNVFLLITLLLFVVGFPLLAQETESTNKLMAECQIKAANGEANAQVIVGNGYLWGSNGLPQNYELAALWFGKAAEQNSAVAQFNLGVLYSKGEGVVSNAAEAVNWYRKAADQNYPQAEDDLGICYAEGQGIGQDDAEAVKWYRMAAEQNYAPAQYSLACTYYTGRGVPKDLAEAANWFRKAAEGNYATAQKNLAVCYRTGQGVAIDFVESYKWYLLGASQGDPASRQGLKDMESLMSPEQMAQSLELARAFRPRRPIRDTVVVK